MIRYLIFSLLLAMLPLTELVGDTGPVGLWHFDETKGDMLPDSAGANHGKLGPGQKAAFRIGGVLAFDGIQTYAQLPPNPIFHFDKPWTFSAWVYPRKRPVSKATTRLCASAAGHKYRADP